MTTLALLESRQDIATEFLGKVLPLDRVLDVTLADLCSSSVVATYVAEATSQELQASFAARCADIEAARKIAELANRVAHESSDKDDSDAIRGGLSEMRKVGAIRTMEDSAKLREFLKSPTTEYQEAAAWNVHTLTSDLVAAWEKLTPWARAAIAQRVDAPSTLLLKMLPHADQYARAAILRNPNVPLSVFDSVEYRVYEADIKGLRLAAPFEDGGNMGARTRIGGFRDLLRDWEAYGLRRRAQKGEHESLSFTPIVLSTPYCIEGEAD